MRPRAVSRPRLGGPAGPERGIEEVDDVIIVTVEPTPKEAMQDSRAK